MMTQANYLTEIRVPRRWQLHWHWQVTVVAAGSIWNLGTL
jgi:hypothetical protein